MIAYDCKTVQSAAVIGCNLEKDPQIKRAIADCLLDAGVTPSYRATKIRAILEEGGFDQQLKGLDHVAKLTGDYTININVQEGPTYHDISDKLKQLEAEEKLLLEELAAIEEQKRKTIDITPGKVGEDKPDGD